MDIVTKFLLFFLWKLWMGTHPKGPSTVSSSDDKGMSLSDWIAKQPECLGSKVRAKFGDKLPFLFKVLSVNKSLSIQAHPKKVRTPLGHVISLAFIL